MLRKLISAVSMTRILMLVILTSAAGLSLGLWFAQSVAQASGAPGAEISIIADSDNPQPSGATSQYTISFSCSAVVGNSCGAGPTITIPLDLTSTNPIDPPDLSTWTYSATSSTANLVTGTHVDGMGNLIISLNEAAITAGNTDSITFRVTPPNNTTPDGTTWAFQPTFSSDAIVDGVTSTTTARGGASAQAQLAVSKNTNDGGSVYVVGKRVVYNITASCNPGGKTGNLYLTSGSLVDTLPSELTFVSATPTPSSIVGGVLTWDYQNSTELPPGCSADGSGTSSYKVVATLNADVPDNTSVVNPVQFSGFPIGTATEVDTSASKAITAVTKTPTDPGAFLGKSALGPLNIDGLGFRGTYAGHWIPVVNPIPSPSSPGAAEGAYTVNINYPASRAYETALVDPVPCLTNKSGVVYSSVTPSGDIEGAGSITPLCDKPAFNPIVVRVSSASLGDAVGDGNWAPIAITTAGDEITLTPYGGVSTSAYFEIPAANIGHIAAILLPRSTYLTDASMSMNVWGYGEASLIGGDVLHNVATATAYVSGTNTVLTTQDHAADLYIEPSAPQLGAYKSFGSLGAGPNGTTALNLRGSLATVATPTGDVVITDLLPYGLTWANPPAGGSATGVKYSVAPSQGASATTVSGSVELVDNFKQTGRQLIRMTLPADKFPSGFYTITAPANLVELTVPTSATTYDNTVQEFIRGAGDQTSTACGPGTGTTASTFESSDPLDLDGDGLNPEYYCQFAASLTVPPSGGPAFQLLKSVKGDLDSVMKYSPGIGDASPGGTGVYTLSWHNTGGVNLTDPVVYDILPHIGDTGVSGNQSSTPRDSQFAPTFVEITGTVPSAVTVLYSESTDPCRPEVYASQPAGCANDWTTTVPDDPARVKSIELKATGSYIPASGFDVSIKVKVPAGQINTVAWNTAATDANYNGVALPPSEPPKVGLTAPAPKATPTISTSVSNATFEPGGTVHDTIDTADTGGGAGTLDWKLIGPLPRNADGTCSALDWSAAPEVDSGTFITLGDGTHVTPDTTLTEPGCYSYVEHLNGPQFSGEITSPADSSGETVRVEDHVNVTIVKRVQSQSVTVGHKLHYTLTVTNTGPGVAIGTKVVDDPKTRMKLVFAGPTAYNCSSSFPLTCTIPRIDPGTDATIKVVARPLQSGSAENTARVDTSEPNDAGSDKTHSSVTATVKVPLKLKKTASTPKVQAGSQMYFTITVTNPTAITAHAAKVCDALPEALKFVSANPHAALRDGERCWTIHTLQGHHRRAFKVTVMARPGHVGRTVNHVTVTGASVVTRHAHANTIVTRQIFIGPGS